MKKLYIGGHEPLSGLGANWGLITRHGTQLAIDEINKNGGIRVKKNRFHLDYYCFDNRYSPNIAVSIANTLIFDEGINFVIGSLASTCNLAVQQLFQEYRVLNVAGGAAFNVVDRKYPYIFRINALDWAGAFTLWQAITSTYPELKSTSIIAGNSEWGDSEIRSHLRIARYYDISVLSHILVDTEEDEEVLGPVLSNTLKLNPDCLTLVGLPSIYIALIMKEVRKLGYKGKMVTTSAMTAADIFPLMTKTQARGIIASSAHARPPEEFTRLNALVDKFIDKYGLNLASSIDQSYERVMALSAGIEYAQSIDPYDVMNAMGLDDFTWEGSYGTRAFGGELLYSIRRNCAMPQIISEYQKDGSSRILFVPSKEDISSYENIWAEMISIR